MHTLLLVFCDRIACLLCAIIFVPSPIACTHPVDVAGDQRHCYFFELFVHLCVRVCMRVLGWKHSQLTGCRLCCFLKISVLWHIIIFISMRCWIVYNYCNVIPVYWYTSFLYTNIVSFHHIIIWLLQRGRRNRLFWYPVIETGSVTKWLMHSHVD